MAVVASWNIAGFCETNLPLGSLNAQIKGLFGAVSADVVVLQEVQFRPGQPSSARHLAELLGFQHLVQYAFSPSHLDEGSLGLAVVSRHPLSDFSVTYFENSATNRQRPGYGKFHSKGGFETVVRTPDGPIRIGNSHFHFPYPGIDLAAEERMQATFVSDVLTGEMPAVVAGDLGVAEGQRFGRKVRAPRCRKGNLSDFLIPGPLVEPSEIDLEELGFPIRVLDDLSDHYPVVCRLEYPNISKPTLAREANLLFRTATPNKDLSRQVNVLRYAEWVLARYLLLCEFSGRPYPNSQDGEWRSDASGFEQVQRTLKNFKSLPSSLEAQELQDEILVSRSGDSDEIATLAAKVVLLFSDDKRYRRAMELASQSPATLSDFKSFPRFHGLNETQMRRPSWLSP